MRDYLVVLEHAPGASVRFVASFGERSLALAFAREGRDAGRALVVVDQSTGLQVFPEEDGNADLGRVSRVRVREE